MDRAQSGARRRANTCGRAAGRRPARCHRRRNPRSARTGYTRRPSKRTRTRPLPSADDHARITRIREHFLRLSDRADKHSPNPLFAGRDELVASVLDDADRFVAVRSSDPQPDHGPVRRARRRQDRDVEPPARTIAGHEHGRAGRSGPSTRARGDLSEALVFAETLEEHFKRGWIAWAKDRQKRGAGFNIAGLIGASVGPDVKGGAAR